MAYYLDLYERDQPAPVLSKVGRDVGCSKELAMRGRELLPHAAKLWAKPRARGQGGGIASQKTKAVLEYLQDLYRRGQPCPRMSKIIRDNDCSATTVSKAKWRLAAPARRWANRGHKKWPLVVAYFLERYKNGRDCPTLAEAARENDCSVPIVVRARETLPHAAKQWAKKAAKRHRREAMLRARACREKGNEHVKRQQA